MRCILILIGLLVFCFSLQPLDAQSRRAKKLAESIWDKKDIYAEPVEVPEKWRNASAVILYQEILYDYDQKGLFFERTDVFRQRVKLQDQLAVEAFSELTFDYNSIFALRLHKPDGQIRIPDISNAIEAKGDHGNVRKMPVEDLAPGDILDYFYITEDKRSAAQGIEPVISVLNAGYPIIRQRLVFLADKRFHFKFRSLNGAPQIRPLKDSDRNIAYELFDEDREHVEEDRWHYDYRDQPTLKLKMLYLKDLPGGNSNLVTSMYDRGEMSKRMTKNDVLELSSNHMGSSYVGGQLEKSMEDTTFTSALGELEYIYAYLRKTLIVDEVRRLRMERGEKLYNVPEYGFLQIDFDFINKMGTLLRERDIPNHVLLAMPASLGVIDDLLMSDEIVPLMRIDIDPPIYLSRPGLHTSMGEIPYLLEGTEAYILTVDNKGRPQSVNRTTLPKSTREDNNTYRHVVSRLDDDLQTIPTTVTMRITGHGHSEYQDALIQLHEYYHEDLERFPVFRPKPVKKESNKVRAKRENREAKIDKLRREDLEEQKMVFEAWFENEMEFEIDVLDSNTLDALGRYSDHDTLVFSQSFTTTSLVSRAGSNYLVDIGKLIGRQVAIDDDELDRTRDVYMPFARSFTNDIRLTIPEGFEVSGLDRLNMDVTNTTGGFRSTAVQEGQDIVLTTYKYYNNNFEKGEDWPKMVEFLEAAYDFSQLRILLKPAQ